MTTVPAKILVVDDTPTNVKLMAGLLEGSGYEVSTASSGSEALDLVAKIQPDLILLDVMMPGLDGYETSRPPNSVSGENYRSTGLQPVNTD